MSSSNETRRSAARANAFRDSFLERLLAGDDTEDTGDEDPERSGEWQVHEVDGRYVLLREWEFPGIDAEACWFHAPEHALLAVAALAAAARGTMFSYGPETAEGRFPIARADGGAIKVIGENRWFDSDFLESLHALEMSRRSPRALAYLLQAAGGASIAVAGSILERRIAAEVESDVASNSEES